MYCRCMVTMVAKRVTETSLELFSLLM